MVGNNELASSGAPADVLFAEAIQHHLAGRLEDGAQLYRRVLAAQPDHADASHNLGVVKIQQGVPAEATSLIAQALRARPGEAQFWLSYVDSLSRAGLAEAARQVLKQGRSIGLAGEAADRLEQALEAKGEGPPVEAVTLLAQGRFAEVEAIAGIRSLLQPDDGATWGLLGAALQGQGRVAEAAAALERAVERAPFDPQVHFNLAGLLAQAGEAARAEAGFRRCLELDPRFDAARAGLLRLAPAPRPPPSGQDLAALFQQGRFAEVEAAAREATRRRGQWTDWNLLGAAVKEQGRFEEALAVFDTATARFPKAPPLFFNKGLLLDEMRRFEDAAGCFRKALALDPRYAKAAVELGAVLAKLGRVSDAVGAFRKAIAVEPQHARAHNDLGNLLATLGPQEKLEAETHYRRAIDADPALVEAHLNLAGFLRTSGRLVEARASCERALTLNPGFADGHQLWATISAYLSAFEGVVEASNRALELGPALEESFGARLYTFSYHPDLSAEAIFEEFVRWGDRFPDPATDFSAHDRTPGRRLKIGYVSPDFRKHTSRFYFMPLMANHDHQAFETFAYSNVLAEDEHTEAFKGVFDHWRGIRGLSDREVAELVRRDGVDILVDCCNHMRDDRLDVFALKPAPIQVTWLGAAWTTGLKTVDYVLFDPYIAPEGTIAREEIVRLPHCFIAYRPPETTAEVAPLPALRGGQVTFGYSGRTERLNHHTFRVWGEILRRIPGSRLILDYHPFADPPTQEHYRQLMARHGLDPDRVEMRRSPNIFEGLGDIDILLDCFPHSGGTMLFDALWMGVPALTLKARPPLGRIGATLMTNLGMTDWVAETEEDYIDKALAFAADIPALAKIRAGLRDRMKASPLMDEQGFAKGVEDAYQAMWERFVAG